ncbi:MAG: hypothetical protein E6Q97_01840 [Desulfurellales bacterium]|nr:MAG: hypothetical protein E6Q97_01840 [Desulfurellales bacterium]
MAEFLLQPATRKAVAPKILLSGASGSGKTLSALLLAAGMIDVRTDADWTDIVVADADNLSSTYYVDTAFTVGDGVNEPVECVTIGRFTLIDFKPPYRPDRWIKLINEVVEAKKKILILDNFSAEWEGEGGVLDWTRQLGGRASDWSVTDPAHNRVLEAIRKAPIPIIATLREKQTIEIVKVPDGRGGEKTEVRKLGMKPKQREGIEYEFDLQMSIAHDTHTASVGTGKDRTGLFSTRIPGVITPETGRTLANWAKSGDEPVGSRGWVARRAAAIRDAKSIDELREVFQKTNTQGASLLTVEQRNILIAAKDAAKARLQPQGS